MDWRAEVSAFVDAAQVFCHLVTRPTANQPWLRSLLSATLVLYAAGLALPDVVVEDWDADIETAYSVSQEEWRNIWQGLGDALNTRRWYQPSAPGIDSPDNEGQAADVGDLADDLADIYGDLMPGLRYWQTGTEYGLASVVWQWKSSFSLHWGGHAVAALRVLHYALKAG